MQYTISAFVSSPARLACANVFSSRKHRLINSLRRLIVMAVVCLAVGPTTVADCRRTAQHPTEKLCRYDESNTEDDKHGYTSDSIRSRSPTSCRFT
jgi:hypothetical protein